MKFLYGNFISHSSISEVRRGVFLLVRRTNLPSAVVLPFSYFYCPSKRKDIFAGMDYQID